MIAAMDKPGMLHVIEEDLSQRWVDDVVDSGVEAIEGYLAKHLAFLGYLDDDTAAQRR